MQSTFDVSSHSIEEEVVVKYTSAKFHVHRVSRMRKYISLRSYGSAVLQLAGLRVVGGRLVLLACIYINNLYKFTPPSFFAVH